MSVSIFQRWMEYGGIDSQTAIKPKASEPDEVRVNPSDCKPSITNLGIP